jgi:hypothetical protein
VPKEERKKENLDNGSPQRETRMKEAEKGDDSKQREKEKEKILMRIQFIPHR